ncbi:PhoX family phosphatase [Rubrivivax sp. A210]|uniref:PhoX family protein n=1 Tax=Rubrivivax sp. A210 TaxID=2772301 RepID=UPI00191AC512|nr:alkaline phosphatase PhoX [Rubrivivax sp. A210]CAD5373480.1 PhoX family phosphatase [Rubrivivax sp. A210]
MDTLEEPRLSDSDAEPGRRAVLRSGACWALAAAGLPGCALVDTTAPTRIGFTEIAPGNADALQLAPDHAAAAVVRWGDAVGPADAQPAWRADAGNSAAEQALQVGQQIAALQYLPLDGARRGLLVLGHGLADEGALHRDGARPWTAEKVRKSQAAVGLSIVEVARGDAGWQLQQPSALARRITAATPLALAGPAAGHTLLKTAADATGRRVLGAAPITALALTPWGTCLAGESGLADIFASADQPTRHERRYGLTNEPALRWFEHDTRFDSVRHPHEPNRHGWVIEFDPRDPAAVPVKRTALGRRAHAALAVAQAADGRTIVYLADATPYEPLARFVSRDKVREGGPAANATLLDEGLLQVARFDADGSGRWLTLATGSGVADAGELLVQARTAADRLGGTRLDGACALAIDAGGWVHAAMAGNPLRGTPGQPAVDAANPRPRNAGGHLLRWHEGAEPDRFTWALGAAGGEGWTAPASLAADPRGRVWMGTGAPPPPQGRAVNQDGAKAAGQAGNNALYALTPEGGAPRRFLVGPVHAAIAGAAFTPGAETMFVAVAHPGVAGGGRSEPGQPRRHSNWPDFSPIGRPRSAVVAVRRLDGGAVGG